MRHNNGVCWKGSDDLRKQGGIPADGGEDENPHFAGALSIHSLFGLILQQFAALAPIFRYSSQHPVELFEYFADAQTT